MEVQTGRKRLGVDYFTVGKKLKLLRQWNLTNEILIRNRYVVSVRVHDRKLYRMTNKRDRATVDSTVVDVLRREVSHLSSRKLIHRLVASETNGGNQNRSYGVLRDVTKLRTRRRLQRLNIILWDWEPGHVELSFQLDYNNNTFQANIMPETDDRSIVTCATDGQVHSSSGRK